jgi:archaellum component FlaC
VEFDILIPVSVDERDLVRQNVSQSRKLRAICLDVSVETKEEEEGSGGRGSEERSIQTDKLTLKDLETRSPPSKKLDMYIAFEVTTSAAEERCYEGKLKQLDKNLHFLVALSEVAKSRSRRFQGQAASDDDIQPLSCTDVCELAGIACPRPPPTADKVRTICQDYNLKMVKELLRANRLRWFTRPLPLEQAAKERRVQRKQLKMVLEKVDSMREGFNSKFESMDKRFEGMDKRFESMSEGFNSKFESMDKRFEGMDKRFESMEKRLERMEALLSRLVEGRSASVASEDRRI